MPILAGIQARNSQVGAIRIGDENDGRPRKLNAFRFTSPSRTAVEQIAGLYDGSDITPWFPRPGKQWGQQWQVYTEVSEIAIALPPGDLVISQDMELYGGGGLARKCDGITMSRPKPGPCQCPQAAACPFEDASPEYAAEWAVMERKRLAALKNPQGCKPKTRFNVMLPDVGDFGVWVLRTSSEEAAAEVRSKAYILEKARAGGVILAARIAIEQRMLMVGGVLREYPVPVIRLDDSMRALASGELQARSMAEQLPPAPGETRLAIAGAPPAVPAQRPAAPQAAARQAAVPAPPPTAQQIADAAAKATTRAQIREMKAAADEHRLDEDMICPPGADLYEQLDSYLHSRWEELEAGNG